MRSTRNSRSRPCSAVEVRNLVLGPGDDGKTIAPEGVKASAFTDGSARHAAIWFGEWVDIIGDEAAAAKMTEVQAGLDDTYFAWAGAAANGKGAYFRIQGPTVFIEDAPQGQPHTVPITFIRSFATRPTITPGRALGRPAQMLYMAFGVATLALFTTLRRI